MKRWIIGQVIIIIMVALIGQICRFNFSNCGIAGLKTVEDTLLLDCGVTYIFENGMYKNMKMYEDDYVNDMDQASIIVIGEPTGEIIQDGERFGQEIIVKQILNDSGISEKDRFYVYNVDGFEMIDGKAMYYGGRSLMSKDSLYLIFLDTIPYDSVLPKKGYDLSGGFFSYLRLSNSISEPILGQSGQINYNDIYQYEYFAESQKILDQIYEIKNRIIDRFRP